MSDPSVRQDVEKVIADIESAAVEASRFPHVPCQVDSAWHAETYTRWATELSSLRDRVVQLEREQAWQPIETVPGGGQRVLFLIPHPNWAADYMIASGFGGDDATPITLERNDSKRHPTHWKPLPASPL